MSILRSGFCQRLALILLLCSLLCRFILTFGEERDRQSIRREENYSSPLFHNDSPVFDEFS